MAWSTGYNPMNWNGIIMNGNYLYVSTIDTITQTDINTGQIINSSWVTGLGTNGGYFAIDNGYIYTTNMNNNVGCVYKIDIANPTPSVFFNTGLNVPVGICIYNGYLYVANSGSNNISKISLTNPSTDYDINWVSSTLINQPVSLYINGTDIYLSNTGGSAGYPGSIYKIDINTKNISFINGSNTGPYYTITIYQNNIYVVANSLNVVQMDLNGNILNNSYETVTDSDGLLFSGNYLYVVDYATPSIYRFLISSSPTIACFKEGTKILTSRGYRRIEDLRKGDLVKTLNDGYIPIDMLGKREIHHTVLKENRIKNQLYKYSSDKYPEVFEDLVITGYHSILVDEFKNENEKEKTIEILGKIYETDYKYRLPACVDERAVVYDKAGKYTIYHIALENENYYMNYGIYANGLLVETCSKRYLKELSNMFLFI